MIVWLTIAETAKTANVSTKTVRRRIADGSLPGYRVGGSQLLRIKASDVEALLRPIPSALSVA